MSFYPIEIDACPGFGWSGGPEFQTRVTALANGAEKRNAEWLLCRHRFSVPYKNISTQAYMNIKKMFLICMGKTHTFLHKDWADYQATDEQFGTGDGSNKTFQLAKVSSSAGGVYTRKITKPNTGVVINVNGVVTSATVSTLDGSVVFVTAPANGAVLSWSGEFFVQVRFDNDALPFTLDDKNAAGFFTNGTIDLLEVIGE